MKSNKQKKSLPFWVRCFGIAAIAACGLFMGVQPALAVDNGPTQTGEICMQKVFGTPVAPSNLLNCTANDIRLSRAISVSPDTCIEGTEFTLEGTFETIVTANARYDAGFFFRIDGGPNARGDGTNATGECSLSALTPGLSPSLGLDGDTCGDLNAGTYNLTFTIPGVQCVDTDGDGFLNLPNCTSWHSNQATFCDITDAFTFDPDTKSKCVCDDDFQVPVIVQSPEGNVEKKATDALVTYTVKVNNTGNTNVTIDTLDDSLYGDLCDAANSALQSNDCDTLVCGATVNEGQSSATCSFKVNYPDPGTGGVKVNTVTATLKATTAPFTEFDAQGTEAIDVNLNAVPPSP